jgi:hypothetical protein
VERDPGTHWIGGWTGPRTGLDDVERGKIVSIPDSNSDTSVVQPVAGRYTDCAILALKEVIGGWRMHNEFNNIYSSPDIIRLIKSTRIILVGHVACMEAIRYIYELFGWKTRKEVTFWRTYA